MTKKERDEALAELSSRIFSAMLEEVLMDVVLESHQEIARSRAVCDICHTRCGAVHLPGSSTATPQGVASSSRLPSPSAEARGAGVVHTAGTNTPVNGKSDGTVFVDCLNCKRKIASNRYAPHLSSCMGLGTSRRGARSATASTKLASEAGRSASPFIASENGHVSDDGKSPAKGKGKSKAKRTDEAEFSLNRKRPGSPSLSPNKKQKKTKVSGPIGRTRTEPDIPGSPNIVPSSLTASQTKIPSKLRDSSILSSTQQDQRSTSSDSPSRFSSPPRSISTPVTAPSLQSPTLAALVPTASQKTKAKNGKAALLPPPPPKRASPPRPPPPVIRAPEHNFMGDVEGEETGSSTDSD